MTGTLLFATFAAAAIIAAAALYVRSARVEAVRRRDLLAECAGLLQDPVVTVNAAGFGVMAGGFDGRLAILTPIAEALAFRRLPQLWLSVELRCATGAEARIEIIRRPTGAEFYGADVDLRRAYAPPAAWPQDTAVRGDVGVESLLARLAPRLAGPLADPRMKLVLVTPRGVRVVRQAAQGERGAYLLFRDVRFAETRIDPAQAQAALTLAAAVAAGSAAP